MNMHLKISFAKMVAILSRDRWVNPQEIDMHPEHQTDRKGQDYVKWDGHLKLLPGFTQRLM